MPHPILDKIDDLDESVGNSGGLKALDAELARATLRTVRQLVVTGLKRAEPAPPNGVTRIGASESETQARDQGEAGYLPVRLALVDPR